MVNGAGSAGIACTKLFMAMGLKHVILCDRDGAIYEGKEGLNEGQKEMAAVTNREHKRVLWLILFKVQICCWEFRHRGV